jgi:hypothetical protein
VTKQRYNVVTAVIADGRTGTEVAKDWLVIRGGFNVFPRDVEDALLSQSRGWARTSTREVHILDLVPFDAGGQSRTAKRCEQRLSG